MKTLYMFKELLSRMTKKIHDKCSIVFSFGELQEAIQELEAIQSKIQELEARIAQYEEFYISRNEAQRIQESNTKLMLNKIKELKLIIKGKDVIIESMAQGKSCNGCWLENEDRVRCMSFGVVCIRHLNYHPDLYKPKENQDVK